MTYHDFVQKEINEGKLTQHKGKLTPMQLREIAKRPLPVYNRFTGERV